MEELEARVESENDESRSQCPEEGDQHPGHTAEEPRHAVTLTVDSRPQGEDGDVSVLDRPNGCSVSTPQDRAPRDSAPSMSAVVRHRLEALGRERAGPSVVQPAAQEVPSGRGDRPSGEALGDAAPEPGRRYLSPIPAFGRAHALALVLLAIAGLAWAGWSVFSGRVTPVAAATPSPQVTSVVPTEAPTPSATPRVRVHVLGAVATPGVVSLDAGSRVEDALAAAGGLSESARPGDLNLAAILPDGAQILVGDADTPGGELRAEGTTGAEGSTQSTVNLNTATTSQLEELPGVGPVTAASIVAWREAHGPFTNVSQLDNVDGIGEATLARLEPHITV